jgi:Tfp pilus assembly protein PilF
VTFFAQSQRNNSAVASLQSIPLHYRILNTLISYGDYLLKLIWPSKLAVIYPLLENLSRMIEMAFFALIALGIISWLCWRARRRCPYLLFGWLWFLGTLVPVIGLVQVGGAALADRYTYFPSIGIFLAVAFGACELANHFRFPKIIFPGGSVLILGACIFLTEKQLSYWRNSETLFRHAVAVTKDNSVALINLGVALDVQGRFDEALIYYHRALSIEPQRYQIHNNIANILDKSGHPEASLREYRAAVLLEPQNAALHNAIGEVLAELGRFAEALNELTNAAQLDANSAAPHLEMGKIFLKQNRSAAAMGQFRAALGIEPEDFQALTYVARVLATDEDATVRDGKMAMLLAAKANALTGGQQPLVLDAFGMACAETGDFTDAIALTQRALAIARAAKMRKLEPLEQRLQFYKNHQPWRESFLAAPPKKSPAQ